VLRAVLRGLGATFLVVPWLSFQLKTTEIDFTSEQEAQLAQIAAKSGTDAERLVKGVAIS
jgi:hypothetical protein